MFELTPRLQLAALLLFGFALAFNLWVGRQEARDRHQGYVSLYVVVGVLAVLGGAAFVVWPWGATARAVVGICVLLFVVAGIPMIAGSINRHLDARERELAQIAAQARAALER